MYVNNDMDKTLVCALMVLSCSSIFLTGVLVEQDSLNQTQHLVIEFEHDGRYEIVYNPHGVPETVMSFGVQKILVSRTVGEHWEVSFSANRLDGTPSPLFVRIKTLKGDTIYDSVLENENSVLELDCIEICNITSLSEV